MGKKSGKAGRAVPPAAPRKAEDADVADPGKVAEIKAEQAKTQSGKYGAQQVKPHKPPAEDEAKGEQGTQQEEGKAEEKTSWIEIELMGANDQPIPGEKYKITLPEGSVAEGTLDENGFTRVEGFEKGTCQVTFPELDGNAWERA